MATRSTRNHSLVLGSDIDKNASHSTLDATVNSALRISGNNRVSTNATGVSINAPDYCEIAPGNVLSLQSGNALNLTAPAVAVYSTTTELTAANHVKLKIGSATVLNATSNSVICEPALKSNVIQLSSGGGMIVNSSGHALDAPGSYHVSSAYSQEVRRITLTPNMLMADDDSSSYGVVISDVSAADPMVTAFDNTKIILGSRLGSGSCEAYVFCPAVPAGWQCTGIYISLVTATTKSANTKPVAVVSRTHEFSGLSTYLTRHLALTTSGTNAFKSFGTTPFLGGTSSYLVAFLGLTNTHEVFTGGYIQIERV